jgi:hypothetical protein
MPEQVSEEIAYRWPTPEAKPDEGRLQTLATIPSRAEDDEISAICCELLSLRRELAAAKERRDEFNINETVWVQLTDHGRAILKKVHAEFPSLTPKETNGWSEWQLWCLMESLGYYMGIARPLVMETTIRFTPPANQ